MQQSHPKLIRPTPFLSAVEHNDPEALALAEKVLDADLRLAILLSAWHGHDALLKSLVDLYETKHAGYQDAGLYGEALAEASQHNHWNIVEFLIEHNANTSFVYHTPLVEALNSGSEECTIMLLKHIDPRQISDDLIKAVVKSGHLSGFQMLLSHIPSLQCNSCFLVRCAVEYSKPFMVEAVGQHMPDFEPYQEYGFIPSVILALEKNDDTSLGVLIEHLHQETLDRAHEKIIDFNQRKHFKSMREAHLSNQRMREKLTEIIQSDPQIRARKM